MKAADFGSDFHWGVASAAYQTEGAWLADGKGLSIWDVFTASKGKIAGAENGRVACDFYNRFIQDLILMKSMNIPCFRFSISWTRIFPEGTGKVNPAGIAFYNQLIDFCLEMGIEPWITLYHWDLPQTLQDAGGWGNRDIVGWFSEYVQTCIRAFGDRVSKWMVLNEPMVFTGAGHFLGLHAPGLRSLSAFFAAAHHASLCQAEGGRVLRSEKSGLYIGTTFSTSHVAPFSTKPEDVGAAARIDAILNRFFVEPLLGLGYPVEELPFLHRMERYMKDGDEQRLKFDMDFIGVQNYTREVVRHSFTRPLIYAQIVSANKRNVETTTMNWEVYPEGIYHVLRKFAAYKNIPDLIVTENGSAFPDEIESERIRDERRVKYLKDYLKQVLRAKRDGVPLKGYFVWTFTDNFEWAEGYNPRFGLVHVDFRTQKRRVKDSGHWYRQFLSQRQPREAQPRMDIPLYTPANDPRNSLRL